MKGIQYTYQLHLHRTAFSLAKRGQHFQILRITPPILQGRISLVEIFLPPLSKLMLGTMVHVIHTIWLVILFLTKHLICDYLSYNYLSTFLSM